MGIDWICTPRPREGHEAEYARLRAVALAELDSLEGFDSGRLTRDDGHPMGEVVAGSGGSRLYTINCASY